MKINKKYCWGISFIEAIISIAIFVFILLALILVYNNFTKVYNYQETLSNLASSARSSANELQNTALQAQQIIDSHDFSGTIYSTDEDTLILEIPSIDGDGNIVDGEYDYAVFYATGSDFYKKTEADSASSRTSETKRLSENLQSVSFFYNNSDLSLANKITMSIEMQKITRRQTVSYALDQEIYIRNL